MRRKAVGDKVKRAKALRARWCADAVSAGCPAQEFDGRSIMHRHFAAAFLAVIASLAAPAAQAQLLPVSIELGDVSLTKLPFVMAAEAGIYRRNGLEAKQYITPRAAELIRQSSGVVVPGDFVGTGIGDINIGGGSPTIVRMTSDARAPQRIVLVTNDPVSRFHIMSRTDITRPEDLKGKRIGFSSEIGR